VSLRVLWILLVVVACPGASALAASGMFPKMPIAPMAYVIDCYKDWPDARMTARALQGMINQQSAEVYVDNSERDWEQLRLGGKPFELLQRLDGNNGGLRALFQKYQVRVEKMIVYDPDKDWTCYLALMAAAQQNAIPVTESNKDELMAEFGWHGEVEDFRNRWSNRIEAYNWALRNLMPGCNKQVVFAVWNQAPLIDYVVASKGFAFGLDFNSDRAEVEKIFRAGGYGVGTSLMGYSNTGDDANKVANPFGIGYVVSDLYANGSYWSSFPDKTYKQTPGKAIPAVPGKVYVHIIWSDGDNIQFDQNSLYDLWQDPARGTIPVGTELAPALQELNTALLDWYYARITTNDELIAGPPGVQFIYVGDFNDQLFPAWCNLTRYWCAGAGFHTSHNWNTPIPSLKYSQYMLSCGFDGVLAEGFKIKAGFPPQVETIGVASEQELFDRITQIKPDPKVPIFTGFTCIVQGFYKGDLRGYSAIKRVLDRVEAAYPGRYVFLLPKDEFATIRAYYNADMPKVIGSPDSTSELTPVYQGDGRYTTVDREGRHCWLVAASKPGVANFFYLTVPDAFRPKVGQTLEIDLAYFDEGNGTVEMDYDSTDISQILGGAYKRSSYVLHRQNSGQWKLARFYVNDAGFGHSENNSSDFRFQSDDVDLLISGAEVQRVGH
jgi:hypothetical protein